MRRILCILAITLLISGTVVAEGIEVLTDKTEISLQDTIRLTLRIPGQSSQPRITVEGWSVSYIGSSNQLTVINGKMDQFTEYSYRLAPTKTGTFIIGPFQVVQDGQTQTTGSITVTVVQGTQEEREDIFLKIDIPKNRVYAYEKVPVTLLLYTRVRTENLQWPELSGEGLLMDEFAEPVPHSEVINGQTYQVVPFQTYVTFIQRGQQTLGPATMKCEVLVQSSSRGGLFPDFFTSYERRPLVLSSSSIAIDVLAPPLPAPEGFAGAVGKFTELFVDVDPKSTIAGEPLTLTLQLFGSGSVHVSSLPALESCADFQVYPINLKEENEGSWVYEQVIIPKAPVREIPSLTFCYFDPEAEEYLEVTSSPVPVSVLEEVASSTTKVAPPNSQERIGQDILFIKDSLGRQPKSGSLPIVIAVSWTLLVGGVAIARFLWSNRVQDSKKAAKDALRELSILERKQTPEEILPVLQNYLGGKYGLNPYSMDRSVLDDLKALDVDPVLLSRLEDLLARLEAVRYARDTEKDGELFQLALDMVRDFERIG